ARAPIRSWRSWRAGSCRRRPPWRWPPGGPRSVFWRPPCPCAAPGPCETGAGRNRTLLTSEQEVTMSHRPRTARIVLPIVALLAAPLALSRPGAHPPLLAAEATSFTQKTVLQNERVRALMNLYPPGTSSPEHEHAHPRVVVVVEGGTLEIHDAAGKTTTLSLKNGDVFWRPVE